MIPIRDYPHSTKTPVVTMALIAANIIIFLIEITSSNLDLFIYKYALTPALVEPSTLYTFITSQFLHGDFMHLGMNMWFLWIFGDNVEENLGRFKYLLFYLLGGVAAALLQYAFDPQASVPMIGASGAVSAILGYYIVRFPHYKVEALFYLNRVYFPAIFFLGFWFLLQITSGLSSLGIGGDAGGVAWWAHVGGFVFGVIIAKLFATQIPKKGSRYVEIKL